MIKFLLTTFFLACSALAFTQDVWMHPNDGQWDERIEFKIDLDYGQMLIEKDGFTFHLTDAKIKSQHSHDQDHEDSEHEQEAVHNQVIKSTFVGSSWSGELNDQKQSSFYRNYMMGNDKSKWKSNLYSYNEFTMVDYYDGIDMSLSGKGAQFKYSFIVQPGIDYSKIKIKYEGHSDLFVDAEGNLHVTNIFGEIIEQAPIAWLEESGKKVKVKFKIRGNELSFSLPKTYDDTQTLIIDPSLTFSSFSGATADNWGFTAAPDSDGNLFGGGIVFGLGYPVTVGTFDSSFNGGNTDVTISKFTSDGANLIYSTYLGGTGSETPNSIVANQNGDLFVFGLTSSANFPMAGSSYDASYAGGPAVSPAGGGNGIDFSLGTDLYLARLSADGGSLIASTFVGGSGNDGLNNSQLAFNYGDQFRGEVALDENGFVYVASMSQSVNFPIVQGSQSSLSGSQDAILFKMTPGLNTMIWSTYFGGSSDESGNAVQIADNGDVYMCGGTKSNNLSFPSGHDLSFGGVTDGYVARFNGANGAKLSGTYIGYSEYDQNYFVQLDVDDNVYVLGQTESNFALSPGVYGVPNSGQFIRKFDHNLGSELWTTSIGSGSGHVEISPTAFLVSDCYDIYLSGWGGNLNVLYSQAVNSSTNGFPITPTTAEQTVTNGSNFYIAVLDQDASNLKYGTYFGGMSTSANHVDGGTSRFDKAGRIYHAVCGSCGAINNGFSTTPGAWSEISASNNCNMAVFKFELSTIEAIVSTPDPIVCLPDPVIFNNNSANGNAFFWDFGDNTYSNDVNPTHLYPGPGNYTVTLVVSDTNNCFSSDSVEFLITIGDFIGGAIQPNGPICPGESFQLEAYGGVDYVWTPAQYLDDPNISMPIATLEQTTDFMVIISDSCGIDTAYVTVPVHINSSTISNDTNVCIGNSVPLFATGGASYDWSPALYLDDPTSATPLCTPANDIEYSLEITTSNGCTILDSVFVDVFFTPPVPVMPDSLNICQGEGVEVTVSGAESYFWYPNSNISAVDTNVVEVNPPSDMFYYCDFSNACGTVTDSVFIDIRIPNILAGNDTIICPGATATLWAQGGVDYYWWPGNSLNNIQNSQVYATPQQATTYYVEGMDVYGCTAIASVFVDLFPQPYIQTNSDVYAFWGDNVQLSATSSTSGPYVWSPTEFLSCVVCENPIANPNEDYTYIVTYTDQNGCSASDSVNIFYDPIIYIPNTFTPNGQDELNTIFKAEGGNIKEFEMTIFNRWGELIITLNDLSEGWDGTYEGTPVQDGTYIWKVKMIDLQDDEHVLSGHVNVLR